MKKLESNGKNLWKNIKNYFKLNIKINLVLYSTIIL